MSKCFGQGENNETSKSTEKSPASQSRVSIGDQIEGLDVKRDFVDKVDVKFQDDGKTKFDVGDKYKQVKAGSYRRDKKINHTLVGQSQAETTSSNSISKPVRIDGRVVIINQEFKGIKRSHRVGSIQDVNILKVTFEGFGMTPIVLPDLTYDEIVNEVHAFSQSDFSDDKLFVFVYMSHGEDNGIVEAADRKFELEETIIKPIMKNHTLNGVAKIFITVACRGETHFEETDGRLVSQRTRHDYGNCIISYSTYKGHFSYRSLEGTYFIQHLCDNLNKVNGDTKIHSVFANVNSELNKNLIQVPVFQSTMGDLSFNDLASTSQ